MKGNIDSKSDDWYNKIVCDNLRKHLSELAGGIRYVHIGLVRTGSTFLQKKVFPHYKAQNHIFSSEAISGRFFDNGIANAKKVHDYCPDAKVVIVLRNQADIINSNYKNYVKGGGIWPFPRYVKECLDNDKYNHAELLKVYFKLFGEENCRVFLFEDFRKDTEKFLKDLAKFLEEDYFECADSSPVNASPGVLHDEILRIGNYVLPPPPLTGRTTRTGKILEGLLERSAGAIDQAGRLLSGRRRTKHYGFEKVEPTIANHYNSSNRELEQILERDLKPLGYA